MECAALADGTKPEDPCHPERPLIEVRNQVTQVIQDGQGCRQQHGKNHRDIIYLYQKTHDLDSDIRRIDSATSSHGIDCLAQLASIEAQRAFTAEHTEERLSSVENRASDVDVGHRVLQQQHQDLQANVRRTDQEVEQRCSNTERGVDTLKQKLDLLEETMKQSRGELEQVLASRDAMRDRLHSAVRCLERDVRRFRPPEVTLDQIDFSRLTISSGSPASEKDEQAIHDTMDARIQELERHQASSSASFTLFRGYSDRQASRIARIERLCRAGRNRSSRGLEAIKQQLVEWESRMQGVDATLTALDAVHNDHQARLVAAEEARLALHQASDQAQQEIDSRFEEHLGTFRRADNELNNVVAMQSSHSCRIEGLRAEMASLDQENSNRWTSVTQNVNDAIEGNVATGKMSRQLAELETQIQLLTRQIARLTCPIPPLSSIIADRHDIAREAFLTQSLRPRQRPLLLRLSSSSSCLPILVPLFQSICLAKAKSPIPRLASTFIACPQGAARLQPYRARQR
ncbi:MAG: hypothetical protein LQ338_000939 [Usnochroma carphineum]|nr:MAG: hypothetical protein LQ338_000939 [Usnochroma carphineum]